MNYKKIFKSKGIRIGILKLLSFVPDKLMIKLQYRLSTGKKLNLKNPVGFSEKLQWYKLYYRNPLLKKCSDKYLVRDYISSKGLNHILVPLIGVYNSVEEIDYDKLPKSFVVKSTLGTGNNEVLVIDDFNQVDKEQIISKIKLWKLRPIKKSVSREWGYQNKIQRIIIEENLRTMHKSDIVDYKFFCFDGVPQYLYIITDRHKSDGPYIDIYDMAFNKLPFHRSDIKFTNKNHIMPPNFDEMIKIAKILSEDFPHVRVDLYNFSGKIYFGELTFYNGSGYRLYEPIEYDKIVGNYFTLKRYDTKNKTSKK